MLFRECEICVSFLLWQTGRQVLSCLIGFKLALHVCPLEHVQSIGEALLTYTSESSFPPRRLAREFASPKSKRFQATAHFGHQVPCLPLAPQILASCSFINDNDTSVTLSSVD